MFEKDTLTTELLRNNEPLPIPAQNLRVKTWFLENNGKVVAVDEAAAWHMLQPNQNIGTNRPRYTIAGVSYAQIYAKAAESLTKEMTMEQRKQILKQAFEDEVAEARKHIERPRNPNIMDISGRPQSDPKVLGNLPS